MSYQVIARKYRPQRFADVVGQEHVTQTLANAITSGRIAHGYLFCGPRGTGKTTLARIFAKGLNCSGGPKTEWDEADPRVKEITEGRSLDMLEIDGASNNGVEQVRELRDTVRFAPAASKFKIYIIDEVHMLTTAAFNALLKTLEEPPAHVKFLFATTDPEKVLPTILSRCQRFDLRRIPSALIVKHLAWIAGQEGVKIDGAALHAIARGADGGMRDAESTLDQLISFCGNEIVESDVLSMFGLAARSQVLALSNAVIDREADTALRVIDELSRGGKDLGRLLGDLLSHFRNLLLFQVSRGDRTLLEIADDEFELLGRQSPRIDNDALTRVMDVFTSAESRLREVFSKRIFLEMTLVRAIQARSAASLDTVLKTLQQWRENPSALPPAPLPQPAPPASRSTPAPSHPASSPPSPTISAPMPMPPASKPSAATVQLQPTAPTVSPETPAPVPLGHGAPSSSSTIHPSPLPATASQSPAATQGMDPVQLWPTVLQSLGAIQRVTFGSASVTAEPKGLLLTFPGNASDFVIANTRENAALLTQRFKELGAPGVVLRFEQAASTNPPTATTAERTKPVTPPKPATAESKPAKVTPITLNKDEFLNDPLIKQALEIFKAQIIEVRAAE